MGQKVNPILIRLGIPSKRTSNVLYLNPVTQTNEDLFHRKDKHQFPINLASSGKGSYGKKLEKIILLERFVEEIFEKSGYLINQLKIRQDQRTYTISVDAYQRSRTSQSRDVRDDGDRDPNTIKERQQRPTHLEKKRKIAWTARKVQWRTLTTEDLDFYGQFFQKYVTEGGPIVWKWRNICTSTMTPIASVGMSNQIHMEDGAAIFHIISKEPGARLLAEYMSTELRETKKHTVFIDYVFDNLDKVVKNSALDGAMLSVKGRINGSDRSKTTTFRKGGLPLHTFDAAIDYSFAEVITPYGVCSIKVWLKYILLSRGFFFY